MNHELLKLSSKQRMAMISEGLSPFNPEHIKKYINREPIDNNEKLERIKTLFENANDLGSGKEKDVNPMSSNMNVNQVDAAPSSPSDFKKSVKEEMSNYGKSAGAVINSDSLLSLKQKPNNYKQEGFNKAKEYLNAFVINLQNPNSTNRLNLYKALQECLKIEMNLKNKPNELNSYKEGVKEAEIAMFEKLS